MARFAAMGTGGVFDAFVGNLIILGGRWAELFATMRFPKVLGMFVLGLWLVRRGIALDPAAHCDTLIRWRRIGLLAGLPANVIGAWAFSHWPYLPPSLGGFSASRVKRSVFHFLRSAMRPRSRCWSSTAGAASPCSRSVGRMALTNYLTHSVVCVVLSDGFAFGLWWRVGASAVIAIAVVIVAIQIESARGGSDVMSWVPWNGCGGV